MVILGFESSCDETGVALVDSKKGLLAHALHSQIDMHRAYGGVVPELASRDHIRRAPVLMREVLREAGVDLDEVDAIAYTAGPGLNGALLVGAGIAQSLAWSRGLPCIPVHHLEGHLLSPLIGNSELQFPFVAMLVSGGHTQIMQVNAVGDYKLLGETLDDAAGEAFDKSAKLLGLPYPGGPHLSKLASQGDASRFNLPRPMLHSKDLDFSFSGLKTAVLTTVRKAQEAGEYDEQCRADIAAAVQEAIVEVLGKKAIKAVRQSGLKRLVVAGGVGANSQLRSYLTQTMEKMKGEVYFPPLSLCTDNGAMIAFAAAQRVENGLVDLNDPSLKSYQPRVTPRWSLEEVCEAG